jgi:hypothetical protein
MTSADLRRAVLAPPGTHATYDAQVSHFSALEQADEKVLQPFSLILSPKP